MSHPSNQGKICVRGWNVHEVASSPDRLRRPMLRRGRDWEEVEWEEALEYVAKRLQDLRDRHGPEALAFLNSPRCSNEESYLLQKLARAVVGTNHVDHGTGVYCHNSIHVLREALGVPATTNSIGELAQSGAILVDGVDLGRQLPTIGGWVMRARLAGAKLIVMDTRRHRLAEHADYFLQIRPGTEAMLYGAMAKVVVDRGLRDLKFVKTRCRGYEAFLEAVAHYDLLTASAHCGVPAESIEGAALAYASARRAAILFSTGTEARARASIEALVNLALLTGNVGREGAGIFALTEHNNLQGACDMGMLPDFLPGYAPVTDSAARTRLESLWRCPRLPAKPGHDARAILEEAGRGRIKGLWLCRYDPVGTASFGEADRALSRLDLVVVQHLFRTASAPYAHVILPVTAFGEERVTFTSTDRRIQVAEKVVEPRPGPRPAWEQLSLLAEKLGASWNYCAVEEVTEEIGRAVPFYSGVTYENLRREYGRHWPCTKDQPLGTRILFQDDPDSRRFFFRPVDCPAPMDAGQSDYPYTLVFGNSLYYWHQNVLIQHSETLQREHHILLLDYPNGFVEVNTEDARRAGVRDGQPIRLHSATGSAVAAARVTPEVRSGTIFVPFFVQEVRQKLLGQGGNGTAAVHVRLHKEES